MLREIPLMCADDVRQGFLHNKNVIKLTFLLCPSISGKAILSIRFTYLLIVNFLNHSKSNLYRRIPRKSENFFRVERSSSRSNSDKRTPFVISLIHYKQIDGKTTGALAISGARMIEWKRGQRFTKSGQKETQGAHGRETFHGRGISMEERHFMEEEHPMQKEYYDEQYLP